MAAIRGVDVRRWSAGLAVALAALAAATAASAGASRDWVVFSVWSGLPVPVGKTLGDLARCGGVWAVRTDGTDLHRLVAGFEPSRPSWSEPLQAVASPDGRSVAVVRFSTTRSERRRIDVLDVETGRIRTVATTPALFPSGVWWSPTGTGFAYLSKQRGRTQLRYVDLAAGTRRLLATALVLDVSFAPDGSRLAAHVFTEDAASVLVLPVTGGAAYGLAADAIAPAWSPDGDKVAFLRPDVDDETYALHVVAPDGSDDRTLATGLLGGRAMLVWTPDSAEVVAPRAPTSARYPGQVNGAAVPTAYALAGGQRTLLGTAALPVGFADGGARFVAIREQLLRGRRSGAENVWTIRVANVGAPGQRIVGVVDEQDVNVNGIPSILPRESRPLGPGPASPRCAATLVRVKSS
ncbi:MAG: hypothetical protein R3C15_11560 [Thermoleophilia bacterium]